MLQKKGTVDRVRLVLKDTHDVHYLESCAPDLTIVREGCVPTAFSAHALIELQVRRSRSGYWSWSGFPHSY